MSKNQLTIVFLAMEMMLPELGETACGANFKGGLGIFGGDALSGLGKFGIKAYAIVPFYHHHWLSRDIIHYERSSAQPLFDSNGEPMEFSVDYERRKHKVRVLVSPRGNGSEVFGLESPAFDVIYTEDRKQRLCQEFLIGKIVPQLLKKLGVVPDVIWLNESHTALVLPEIKEDPYFANTKILFTIHTPEQAGMEKFYDWRFDELKIVESQKYKDIFVRDGVLDLTWAAMVLADWVNAVSLEHEQTTKEMFPQFASKIAGIRNGSDRNFWISPRLREKDNEMTEGYLCDAHEEDKREALKIIERHTSIRLDPQKPTIWWVRRLAAYKNLYPMLKDIIRAICAEQGTFIDTSLGRLEGLGMQMVGAGRPAETDNTCLWWAGEFNQWTRSSELGGKFIFLPTYDLELLKIGAQGCDLWLCAPEPRREACGTSDQRSTINGNPVLTTKTGGAMEYIQEFDPATCQGNGFFIEPYNPRTIYEKLKLVSKLYYLWQESGDSRWLKLRRNAFETGRGLDVTEMVKNYHQKIFSKPR